MRSPNNSIAIVGMGATGTAALVRLLHRLATKRRRTTRIDTYELASDLGSGLAYSTRERCHRLNMRASTMSVRPNAPDDFVQWLGAGRGGSGSEYVPRRLFGQYLRQRLSEAEALGRSIGVEVRHHAAVTDCRRHRSGVELRVDGLYRRYGRVLLSLGYLPAPREANASPRFIASPWDTARLRAVDARARVGILGSSLTAVDVVLSLEAAGFRGDLRCFTRSRGLPRVQPPASEERPPELRHVTASRIEALTDGGRRKLELPELLGLVARCSRVPRVTFR